MCLPSGSLLCGAEQSGRTSSSPEITQLESTGRAQAWSLRTVMKRRVLEPTV